MEKGKITHRPMTALALIAVCTRLFYLFTIDLPENGSAQWLCALCSAALSLPAAAGAYAMAKLHGLPLTLGVEAALGKSGSRALYGLFALLFTLETAELFVMLTSSGSYATHYDSYTIRLLVPTALALIFASAFAANGIGGAAILWLYVFPIAYALILLLEYRAMKTAYLFPLLANGTNVFMHNALNGVWYFCMLPISFIVESGKIVAGKNREKPVRAESIVGVFAAAAMLLAALLIINACMYPSLSGAGEVRCARLDLILATGKSERATQLPVLIAWFGSLLLCGAFMIFCASRFLEMALKKESLVVRLLPGSLALLPALFKCLDRNASLLISRCAGIFACAALALLPLLARAKMRKGGKRV